MKKLFRAVPHLTIVLGLMTLTFFCIDRVNRGMAFMTSELSKWVFMLLAVLAIASSVSLIAHTWREDARAARKAQRRHDRALLRETEEEFPEPEVLESEPESDAAAEPASNED